MSTQTIHLRRIKYNIPSVVHMVQGDTGRNLKMIIDDEDIRQGAAGVLCFLRPDGTEWDEEASFSASENAFTANCEQGITRSGEVKASLKVSDGSGTVSTYLFAIEVHKSISGEIEEQAISTVQSAILIAQSAKTEADAAAGRAATATGNANTAAAEAASAAAEANLAAATANAAAEAVAVVTGPFAITNEATGKVYNCNIAIQASGKPVMLYEELTS